MAGETSEPVTAQNESDVNVKGDDVDETILNSDVCTKYREAAKIVNLALEGLVLQVTVSVPRI